MFRFFAMLLIAYYILAIELKQKALVNFYSRLEYVYDAEGRCEHKTTGSMNFPAH